MGERRGRRREGGNEEEIGGGGAVGGVEGGERGIFLLCSGVEVVVLR